MADNEERAVTFDRDDFAIPSEIIRVVHDSYDVVDPVALDCKAEDLRAYQARL